MNLCRCEKGHFYDKEKYATCPHCAGGSASDEKLTEAFTEDFTVPVTNTAPAGPPVASSVSPVMEGGQLAIDSAPPVAQPMPPIVPPVSANPLPMTGLSANQVTIAMNSYNTDTPTVPLPEVEIEKEPDMDDDHTIGFFDDVFSAEASAKKKPVSGASAKMPVVNKVNTPCVGWMIALGGEHIGTDFRLKAGKNFIGRSIQMDVALTEDKSVSRERHAIVVYDPKSNFYLVQPGESSSLVYHNNKLVLTPEKLEAYDMVTVGDINLLFIPLCGERFNWGELLEEMKKKNN